MKTGSAEKYRAELAKLGSKTHARHNSLCRIAILGITAGIPDTQIAQDMQEKGGLPTLTNRETLDAVRSAHEYLRKNGNNGQNWHISRIGAVKWGKTAKVEPLNEIRKRFVLDCINVGKGATSASLMALSGMDVLKMMPREQATAFCRAIFREGDIVFAGSKFTPRTRENLNTREGLCQKIESGSMVVPELVVPNALTGQAGLTTSGKQSYCCNDTVAKRRMALIEFDNLPLPEQAAFWSGLIQKRLVTVKSLVFSGGKSIHGLVELVDNGTVETWQKQWKDIEQLFASDDDERYRCDVNCKNAGRMTRMAGAVREGSRKVQRLLYLAR